MARMDGKINSLWDYAVSHPEGFTRYDIERDFGWTNDEMGRVVRRLRLVFADDTVNLICDPAGMRQAWTYKLIGTPEDARVWATNRHGDMMTRLETTKAVAETLENGTDGRSIEGRKARKVNRTIGYLLAELGELEDAA